MAAKSKELRVELTAGVKGFQKGFKEAEGIAQGWGKKLGASFGMIATPAGLASIGIGAVTAGIAAVGAAAAAAGAGLALATKGMLDYGGAIGEAADRSGHTITYLQEMKYAASQVGMELTEVTSASTKLRKAIGDGTVETERYLGMLGLSLQELRDSSPDEQLSKVLKSIEALEDPTVKTAAALGLMGKSATGMIDLANGLDAGRQAAHDLGQVMDEDAVRAADALGDRIVGLKSAFAGMTREIGAVITSNESLHQLIDGLAEVFATLTGSVRENNDGFQSLVSHGVLLLVKGLQLVAKVASESMFVFSGLQLAWNKLNITATNLAIGYNHLARAKATLFGDDKMAEMAHNGIAALEREKAALERNEEAIIVNGLKREQAIIKTSAQLKQLEKDIAESIGKTVTGPGGRPRGRDVDLDADRAAAEAKRRADAAARDQERADRDAERAMEQRYRTSMARIDAEAEMEDKAREGAKRFEELKIEWIQERLDEERAYYDELDRLDALDENAARLRDEETARLKQEQLEAIRDTIIDTLYGLGDFAEALGLGDFGGKVQEVAGFADNLGRALDDGVLSWGEMLALGGQAIAGIKSVFSTPKWEKLAAGVGRKWGVTISDELAKQIEEDSDKFGDNVAAMLANLPEIIEEAGGIGAFGFDKAAAGAHDLFSMIETGKMTVAEAGETFDEVFGQMLPEALDSVTGLAKDSFLELIELDKRFGTNSKNVQAFIESQNTALMKGLEAVAKGGKVTEKSAAGVAASVVVAYKQLREQGVSARDALQQMAPSLDTLREKLEELGVGGGEAFDLLAQQSALYADETAGPLLEAINGAGEALAALHNMNALTQESFSGLTASIGDTYNELVATGQAGPAAMQAIAPDLQRVWELQQKTGYAVDETTQALLNEAVAAGIVGESHVSAQDKMAQSAERLNVILEAIAKSMGIDIPAAAQSAAEGVQKAFDGIVPPDLNGSYSYTGGVKTDDLPHFRDGGVGEFGDGALAVLHKKEWIVPDDDMQGLLSRGGGPSIAIDARSMLDPRQNYESERRQNERVASITAERMVRKLSTAIELGSA